MIQYLLSFVIQAGVTVILIYLGLLLLSLRFKSFRSARIGFRNLVFALLLSTATFLWHPEKKEGIGQLASSDLLTEEDEE